MVIGRDARRVDRRARVAARFPADTEAVLDVLALGDLAWHDTYGDLELPPGVIEDVLVLSTTLNELISAVTLGLADGRDLRMAAENLREGPR